MFEKLRNRLESFCHAQLFRMVFVTTTAHCNSISVGLTQGFSAIILPQLTHLTADESSWVASLGVITTPIGALLTGPLVDFFGRKRVLQMSCLPFFFGWVLIGKGEHIGWLYAGRILTGFASGMTTSSYIYVSEISSKNLRSVLSAFGPIFVSLGILIIYTGGLTSTWQVSAMMSTIVPVLALTLSLFIPESPAWCKSQNLQEEALKVAKWLKLSEIGREPVFKQNSKTLKSFLDPVIYKPLLILIFFFLFQSGSGIYIFLFYTINIIKQFHTEYDVNLVTVILGTFRFLMAILGAILLSKFGRKSLAISSAILMSFSVGFVALSLHFKMAPFIPIFGVLLHIGFSMVGLLQLPWILASELFPVHLRGICGGFVCSLGYLFIFTSIKIYPGLCELFEMENILWMFCLTTVIAAWFFHCFLPETKSRSLEEISDLFRKCDKTIVEIQVVRY